MRIPRSVWSDRRLWPVVGLAAGLIALLYVIFRWGPITHTPGSDFGRYFLPAGKQVLHGGLHYVIPRRYTTHNVSVYRYPPIAAFAYAVVAGLSYHLAAIAWWAIGLAALGGTALMLSIRFARGAPSRLLLAGSLALLLLTFAPLSSSIPEELDTWILALVAGAYCLTDDDSPHRRVVLAGALLGTASALKVYPILILIVLVATRPSQRTPLFIGALAAIAGCFAIPAVFIGVHPIVEYFRTLGTQSSVTLAAFPWAFGMLNIADRALTTNPWSGHLLSLPPSVIRLAYFAFVLAVLTYAVRYGRRYGRDRRIAWSQALLVSVLCSPFLESWHMSCLVLLPIILLDTPRRSLSAWAPFIVGATACASAWYAIHPQVFGWSSSTILMRVVSVVLAVAVGFWTYRASHADLRAAAFSTAFTLIATPAFVEFSVFPWAVPMSSADALIGSFVFLLVLALFALVAGPRSALLGESTVAVVARVKTADA